MKCRDLMVGDWITNRNGFPMQITNVGEDYAYATFEGNEGDPWEFDDKDDQPQPHQIRAAFATYTTAHGNTGSLTPWARPGIKPTSSWILPIP